MDWVIHSHTCPLNYTQVELWYLQNIVLNLASGVVYFSSIIVLEKPWFDDEIPDKVTIWAAVSPLPLKIGRRSGTVMVEAGKFEVASVALDTVPSLRPAGTDQPWPPACT